MDLSTILQLLQTASVVLAMAVAVGTIRGRGDDKTVMLTEMRKDIDYIKRTVDCIPAQTKTLIELEASCKSAHKRLDEHLILYHKKEETP